jgi:hypothetical protein
MSATPRPRPPELDLLLTLIYELLDAHRDTLELSGGFADEPWRAHLDYLRALQRRGRELLASADAGTGAHSAQAAP